MGGLIARKSPSHTPSGGQSEKRPLREDGATRDLVERGNAQEALRRSEERLRLLIESVKDYAIFMLDPQGVVTTWNAGAERIKGYKAAEIIGKHFSTFYPPEATANGHPQHELRIAAQEGRYEEEGWRVRKDGTRFWANIVLTAIHDPVTGELRGFAKVTRDLTERRRMEEQANRAAEEAALHRARTEEARAALRQRDEFISVAAHELRTPLSALLLKLGGIKKLLESADAMKGPRLLTVSERVEGALRQTGRLSELIERLLDTSQIVEGRLRIERQETDLASLARRVVGEFQDRARETGSTIDLVAPESVTGRWDRSRIEQVMVNLVSNAIKYGEGKPVELAIEATQASTCIRVTDHGVGIPAEDTDRIFARFERGTPPRHYPGLGLGLYITKSLVEAHGGTIRVFSRPGDGSTFVVDLPRLEVPWT